ncbi:hypothetical protein AH04_93 [Erwinia phage AH04]|uniref:Uncharacterized protein n=1 Tax=Erwinia phage AH04 TaxID=2869569 RepID=A0AAE8BQB1_9CAUD|nr:hypothetical protein PQC02_gp221 [Erwinia phage AH04]QZA70576.1 hypothetical protein AH04_93 [Erwinia phage AH04]
MSDMIDLTNVDLGVENMGEMWVDFIARCTPHQATLFNESYNLIAISFPESFIDNTLNQLFIDETLDTSELMAHVRVLLINTIIDALQMMGIIIDKDFIELNSLVELKSILDTIYLFDGLTDLLGLVEVLNNEEQDCKDRFIQVVEMTQPQYDISNAMYFIKEVSPNTIRGILIGLNVIDEDDATYVDHTIRDRIKANKVWLGGTLGGKHIIEGGGGGQLIDGYLKIFMSDLAKDLATNPFDYLKNVLSLMLISALSDAAIYGQFSSLVEDQTTTIEEAYKAMEIIKKVKLNA